MDEQEVLHSAFDQKLDWKKDFFYATLAPAFIRKRYKIAFTI
jgi:hypothetical protein